jgi:hypothetical protein
MTTFNLTKGNSAALSGKDSGFAARPMVELDFAKTPYGAADVLQVFNVPAGTLVRHVAYEVVTAEGATLTFDIGDGDAAAGYISNANGNSAGARGVNTLALTEATPNTVTGYSGGKFYSAADTIDITLDHAVDAGKIRVWAEMVPFHTT